jgi:hypothetical protein
MTADDQVMVRAAAAVDDYIVKSKHWERGSYQVTFNRKEGTMLVFWVLHSEDRATKVPGTGMSVEVYVDPASNSVLKELAFQ